MKNRRYFIDLILIVALVVVAFSVYPRKKGSSEKKEKSSVTTSAKTEAKTTEKKTTEKKTTTDEKPSFKDKYGYDFCRFVYHKVIDKKKNCIASHYPDGILYQEQIGITEREYYQFGVKKGDYLCFEYAEAGTDGKWVKNYQFYYFSTSLHGGKEAESLKEKPSSTDWFSFEDSELFNVK